MYGIEARELVATCNIQIDESDDAVTSGLDLSEVSFKLRLKNKSEINFSRNFVSVLNETAVKLVYPNLSLDMDFSVLFCCHMKCKDGKDARVMVYVGRK